MLKKAKDKPENKPEKGKRRRKHLPSLSKLCTMADKAWAAAVRRRAGCCELCGSDDTVQSHHMIAKKHCAALRYSLENGMALCRRCHYWFHYADSSDAWFRMLNYRPHDLEFIRAMRGTRVKRNRAYYMAVLERLGRGLE